jgi:hypothetical protein
MARTRSLESERSEGKSRKRKMSFKCGRKE